METNRVFLILAMDKKTGKRFESYVFATSEFDLIIEETLDAYISQGYDLLWCVVDTTKENYSLEREMVNFEYYISKHT